MRIARVFFRVATTWMVCMAAAPALSQTTSAPAQTPPAQATTPPPVEEYVEVVATRIPEPPDQVPAGIEVISGEDLLNRGAKDLQSALALAAGVDIAPGGDGGPASSVPEFWGLREFDAFLLVVDGVPWGGAFNPALATLNLTDVERIEILRGAAPVTYGATSFVGVIHVVHKNAATSRAVAAVRGGSYGSGGVNVSTRLPFPAGWDSRISGDFDRQGYRDDRTSFVRGHVLWSNVHTWGKGKFWFNVDTTVLDQDPASPTPREGPALSPLVALDANYNPDGAFLNERRSMVSVGFERPSGSTGRVWSTTVSFSHASQDMFRGFLDEVTSPIAGARGLREKTALTDLYADSHMTWPTRHGVTFVAGADFLHGLGAASGAIFDYDVAIDGSTAPIVTEPSDLDLSSEDRREFFGAYGLVEWQLAPHVALSGGLRLNITNEERGESNEPAGARGNDSRTNVRPSGSVGLVWTAWEDGPNRMRLYTGYKNTFKPAAVDFGLGGEEGGAEGEGGPLKPETSQSIEGGVKARTWNGRLWLDAGLFLMNFENLVVAQTVNGVPGLINAGKERFQGLETAAALRFTNTISGRATYSYHDATFRDFVQEFDDVPTQLGGKRLEMSANNLASAGLLYSQPSGIVGAFQLKYIGSRYLNKRNTALANGYATFDLGAGYRHGRWEARLDGRNLNNTRPPVAESELGDAQYYRLTARDVDVSFIVRF